MSEYTMRARQWFALVGELDSLNKQAKKLGCEPITYREISRREREVRGEITNEVIRVETWVTVDVEGGYPKLSGWHFVGVIEPTDAGNVIKTFAGETVPEKYWNATNFCDHCRTDRYRLATFIVRHDDGRTAQVGRNCLAKYLGSDKSPAVLAKMAEFGDLVREQIEGEIKEDSGYYGSSRETYVETIDFLTHVASLARNFGFVTRKYADVSGEQPTGWLALAVMTSSRAASEAIDDGWDGIKENDVATAQAARAWGLAIEPKDDFSRNMNTVAKLDALDRRQVGIAAYMIEGYRRDKEGEIKREIKEKAPKVESKFVSEVGKRESFHLTVARVFDFASDYGGSWRMVKFLDDAGNILIWKSGTATANDMAEGDVVDVKATVKSHDFYRDDAQTVLTRVGLL